MIIFNEKYSQSHRKGSTGEAQIGITRDTPSAFNRAHCSVHSAHYSAHCFHRSLTICVMAFTGSIGTAMNDTNSTDPTLPPGLPPTSAS